MNDIGFADLLVPGGIVIAGGIITTLVELLKRVFPALDARVSGALMAFVLSAILYILAAIATEVREMNAGLVVFLAWLATATSAVGINSTITHVTASKAEVQAEADVKAEVDA